MAYKQIRDMVHAWVNGWRRVEGGGDGGPVSTKSVSLSGHSHSERSTIGQEWGTRHRPPERYTIFSTLPGTISTPYFKDVGTGGGVWVEWNCGVGGMGERKDLNAKVSVQLSCDKCVIIYPIHCANNKNITKIIHVTIVSSPYTAYNSNSCICFNMH